MGAAPYLPQGAALALDQETLSGADLDQQRLQVGEGLVVWELHHSHGPLGGVHVAHPDHALPVGPWGEAHGHHSGTGLGPRPAPEEDLLELGQVSRRGLDTQVAPVFRSPGLRVPVRVRAATLNSSLQSCSLLLLPWFL